MRTTTTLLALSSLAPVSLAQVDLVKLTASDGGAGAHFGTVALSSDLAIVGASGHHKAYLVDVSTGQELFELTASDGATSFGMRTSISGDRALVGTWSGKDGNTYTGAAYLFDTATGLELYKWVPSDGEDNDFFGFAVSISGDRALVGAWGDDDLGVESGSAYLFDTTDGQELFKLTASDGASNDRFGSRVAISGDRALVSAPGDDDLGGASGAVYVFDVTTGQELRKLKAADGASWDGFGSSVAIDGDVAVIGSDGDDDLGPDSGSAYVFDVATGLQLHKLTASNGQAGDELGRSAAVSGTRAVVGAELDDLTGAAYVFDTTTGQELASLTAPDATPQDGFAIRVAISGDVILIGSLFDDDLGSESGSVYVFGFPSPIGTSYCGPANLNSSGSPGVIAAQGFVEAFFDQVTLTATQLAVNQPGYFINGPTQGFVANPGGSQGNLCLSGAIGRHTADVFFTGVGGVASLELDLANLPFPGGGHAIVAGETWNWSAWFRDDNPSPTSNFTDGISIVFE